MIDCKHEFVPMCVCEDGELRPCPPELTEGDFCRWCGVSWRDAVRGFGSNVIPKKLRKLNG